MANAHKIIFADARRMTEVTDQSVQLVVTSPPYWQLKDYGDRNQIGFHDSYEEYINNLNLVWQECYRVLSPGCRLGVNIGDQFARSVYYGRYKVIPIRTEIIKFCETAGFDYMGAIIWQKVTTCNTTGGATIMGSFPYPRNGILKLDYEFILLFKKPGPPPKVSKEIKEQSKMTTEQWNTYFAGHWNFPGERQQKHLAMFPEELPRRLIKMFTFVGETVLDPFLGSGTTSLAAKKLGRNSIGYEINPEFRPLIAEKLGLGTMFAGENSAVEFIVGPPCPLCPPTTETDIEKLPYLFKDPVRFDKKVDPRKLTFGSKINATTTKDNELFFISRVLSPELLLLRDRRQIRLLGIKTNPTHQSEAVRFLGEKIGGRKIRLKFDDPLYDRDNNLLCYVYLQNKTFINAHLIKRGLVDVDTTRNYRQRDKFLALNTKRDHQTRT